MNGTPEKLKKRFVLTSSKSILLGAGSFWEGIDLPEEKLELLVITRLPFQAPDSLINKVRYRNVQAKGHNPFSAVSLPEAALKFRQGFGRLIRTKTTTAFWQCWIRASSISVMLMSLPTRCRKICELIASK